MGWARETVDAAVLAPAKGVDRAVEADVRGIVAGQDRFGVLDRHRRPALRHAVECFDLVEPFAFGHALLEIEAGWGGIAGCAAALVRLDRHPGNLNQQWNISRTKRHLVNGG